MGIALQPTTQASGVQTLQDLYDLINGKTTTTSGGDVTTSGVNSTQTTSEGISQDSMNAMLKSALEGSQGLASVAQGQRTAGGYNSATNKMLVNDLMTRSASQIAQQNKTKVVQTVAAPQTQSVGDKTVAVGGLSVGGAVKSAGVLGLGQAISGGSLTDLTGALKNLGVNLGGNGPTIQGTTDLGPSGNEGMSNISQYAAYGAGRVSPEATADTQPNLFADQIPTQAIEEAPAQVETPAPDIGTKEADPLAEFADGGLVSKYADGGKVTKKGSAVLSTNQFAKVIDPRTGLIGGGIGYNEEGVAQGSSQTPGSQTTPTTVGSQTTSTPTPTSGGNSDFGIGSPQGTTTLSEGTSGGSDISGGLNRGDVSNLGRATTALGNITGNAGLAKLGVLGSLLSSNAVNNLGGITERALSGDTTRADVGDTSKIVGSVGVLAGNTALKNISDIGSIASSGSLGEAATKIGDKLSGGVVSKIKNLGESVMSGDMQTGVNALASLNPLGVAANAALSLGDTSVGKVVTTTAANLMPGDSLDNYLGLRNNIGTAADTNPEASQPTEATQNQDQAASDQAAAMAASTQSAGSTNTGFGSLGTSATSTNLVNAVNEYTGGGQGGGRNVGSTGIGGGVNNAAGSSGLTGSYGSQGTEMAADGGEISGPGGGVDDKIHAMLSDGEYVLSADTVKAIGVDTLDKIQAQYHTPAAVQKLMNFGKGR